MTKSGLTLTLAALSVVLLLSSVTIIPALEAFADDEKDKDDKKPKKKPKICHVHHKKYHIVRHCHPIGPNHPQ